LNINPTLLIAQIDSILPQTQCRQCGFDGCKPYATAIANGEARINQCPPGGDVGIHALADVTGLPFEPLNTAHGEHKPKALAVIDETVCIGCTLCLQACPVDAILGAHKYMHTVIAKECTGCELCIAPCPVDCIDMIELDVQPSVEQQKELADNARTRFEFRQARISRDKQARAQQYADFKTDKAQSSQPNTAPAASKLTAAHDKKAAIAATIARAAAMKSIPK
jgi:electron transport complex protein RnfB